MKQSDNLFQIASVVVVFILLILWQYTSISAQELVAEIQLQEVVYHVVWSPDAELLAVGTDNGIRIYTDDLQEVVLLKGHTPDAVDSLSWKPDGTQLVSVGFDATPIIWERDTDTNTFNILTTLPPDDPQYKYVRTASWSPDSGKLAVVRLYQPERLLGILGVTEIMNTQTWLVESTLHDETFVPSNVIEWDQSSSKIASAFNTCTGLDRPLCGSPTVYVADITTGQTLWIHEHLYAITYDLAWAPDDSNRLAAGIEDVIVLGATTGQRIHTFDIDDRDSGGTFYVDWKPDGTQLAGATGGGLVKVLDSQTGDVLRNFNVLTNLTVPETIGALVWSPVGDKLAIGTAVRDEYTVEPGRTGRVEIWFIGDS